MIEIRRYDRHVSLYDTESEIGSMVDYTAKGMKVLQSALGLDDDQRDKVYKFLMSFTSLYYYPASKALTRKKTPRGKGVGYKDELNKALHNRDVSPESYNNKINAISEHIKLSLEE